MAGFGRRAAAGLALLVLMASAAQTAAFWPFGSKKAEAPQEEAPAVAAEQAATPTHFWFNSVTSESKWEQPQYEFLDEEGAAYWVDPESGAVLREKPASLYWISVTNEEGKVYYANELTQATQWERPVALAWDQVSVESVQAAQHAEL